MCNSLCCEVYLSDTEKEAPLYVIIVVMDRVGIALSSKAVVYTNPYHYISGDEVNCIFFVIVH